MFIDSIRLRYQYRAGLWDGNDHANTWNEVNFFVDAAGELQNAMVNNLIGLVYIRTNGNDAELAALRQLQAHWQQLGFYVPLFAMSAEDRYGHIESWQDWQRVDLLGPPYYLEQLS